MCPNFSFIITKSCNKPNPCVAKLVFSTNRVKVREFLWSVSKYGTPVSDDTNWFRTLPPKIVLRSTEDERRNAKSACSCSAEELMSYFQYLSLSITHCETFILTLWTIYLKLILSKVLKLLTCSFVLWSLGVSQKFPFFSTGWWGQFSQNGPPCPQWCWSFVGWHIELVLVERRQWHLGSRALGCHGSPPSVLGSHSVDYSLFDLLASGLVCLCPWFGDTVIDWEYALFLLHPQFGSNSPCSPSPCGPGALCEVVSGSDEWTII